MLSISIRVRGVVIADGSNADSGSTSSFSMSALMIAREILLIGPAAADMAMSFFGLLKFEGFMGTGFAYPKTNCPFDRIRSIAGMIIVPTISICASGFSVSLPMSLAVGSPSLFATKPWAVSWNVIAIRIGSADMTNCLIISEISVIIENVLYHTDNQMTVKIM